MTASIRESIRLFKEAYRDNIASVILTLLLGLMFWGLCAVNWLMELLAIDE